MAPAWRTLTLGVIGIMLEVGVFCLAAPALANEGAAKLCVDKEFDFSKNTKIELPDQTVFFDNLGYRIGENPGASDNHMMRDGAALITQEPVVLTKNQPCASARVRLYVKPLAPKASLKVDDRYIFRIDDVLKPSSHPAVEYGSLVDNETVYATIETDLADPAKAPVLNQDSLSAECLNAAQQIAKVVKGSLGEQTSSIVPILGTASNEMSVGCGNIGALGSISSSPFKRRNLPPQSVL